MGGFLFNCKQVAFKQKTRIIAGMNTTLHTILAASAIMAASLSGIIFAWKRFGSWTERNLRYLATCSIGVFSVIIWGLFVEAHEHQGIINVASLVLAGIAFMSIISKIIPEAHHHHEGTGGHDHSPIDARRMMLGDAIHNVGDGLLLVPAFLVDVHVGIATAVAIFFHELVQETSEFFVLKQAGYSNKKALGMNFLVSSTIFIGIGLALGLSSVDGLADALIPFAAGGFLYVVARDLIPHTVKSIKGHGKASLHLASLIVGVTAMATVSLLAPHSHEGEDAHADELPEAAKNALMTP
jgi:zinc and cadmium transporter